MVHKGKSEEIQQWKTILKRDNSLEDQVGLSIPLRSAQSRPATDLICPLLSPEQSRCHLLRDRQSKSMEEREEEYQRARERIFNKEVRGQKGQSQHKKPRGF